MSKVISALVSIGLLVAVDRAAEYWHRYHDEIAGNPVKTGAADLHENPITNATHGLLSNDVLLTNAIQSHAH